MGRVWYLANVGKSDLSTAHNVWNAARVKLGSPETGSAWVNHKDELETLKADLQTRLETVDR